MSLGTDVQDQLRRFIIGLVSADDLSDWLDAHAQRIHNSDDVQLRRLTDLAFSLLEDEASGLRTDAEVRAILEQTVPSTVT